mmetsp:Transcript_36211/g.83187  ORF Transcript_36211/g.83187 Transcript_36211/m.83187 type:complete len:289 (-) Transcript_36211:2625-3491(-)
MLHAIDHHRDHTDAHQAGATSCCPAWARLCVGRQSGLVLLARFLLPNHSSQQRQHEQLQVSRDAVLLVPTIQCLGLWISSVVLRKVRRDGFHLTNIIHLEGKRKVFGILGLLFITCPPWLAFATSFATSFATTFATTFSTTFSTTSSTTFSTAFSTLPLAFAFSLSFSFPFPLPSALAIILIWGRCSLHDFWARQNRCWKWVPFQAHASSTDYPLLPGVPTSQHIALANHTRERANCLETRRPGNSRCAFANAFDSRFSIVVVKTCCTGGPLQQGLNSQREHEVAYGV